MLKICGETYNSIDFGFGFAIHLDWPYYITSVPLCSKPMHSGLKPTFNCIWLVYDAQGASEVICLGMQGIDYKDKMLKVICGVIIFF